MAHLDLYHRPTLARVPATFVVLRVSLVGPHLVSYDADSPQSMPVQDAANVFDMVSDCMTLTVIGDAQPMGPCGADWL